MSDFDRPWVVVVPDALARGNPYGALWRDHFVEGAGSALARPVVPDDLDFSWARPACPGSDRSNRSERELASGLLYRRLEGLVREGECGVLSYCFAADLDLEMVRRARSMGVTWVNFFCDGTHRFDEVAPLARLTSLNWFPEHAAASSYRGLGVPALCAPYALNRQRLPDCTPGPEIDRPAGFVGMPSANRITHLGWMLLRGCEIDIRGKGWLAGASTTPAGPFHNPVPLRARWRNVLKAGGFGEKILRRAMWPLVRRRAGGPLPEGEMAEYLKRTRVVLGLNQGRDAAGRFESYLKFRDLEFPGYGCCYLTEANADVAKAFRVGSEILTYRSIGEAAEWIREMTRDPDRALSVGRAGRARVLAAHNWETRLAELKEALRRS